MKKTARQIQNLKDALVWWQSVPDENVANSLSFWAENPGKEDDTYTDCGTIACFGGWCARQPLLIAQGVEIGCFGQPAMSRTCSTGDVADAIFGDYEIFIARGDYPSDRDVRDSDKELVTRRIQHALKQG